MTNIEQFTRELMLAHDIGYEEAHNRAYDFYRKLKKETPPVLNDGWISVKDIPIPSKQIVIFCTFRGYVAMGDLCGEEYIAEINDCTGGTLISEVTHWQPLPEPPKEK